MKQFYFMLAMLFLGIQHQAYAEDDKVKIPDEQKWGTVNASNSYGSSSFTKSGLYIYDTVSSSGFVLSPNPVVNTTEVNLTIVDKARSLADEYIISVYKDNQLVLYFESQELQNKLNVNSFEDGEYLVVLEKNDVKSEQKLLIKKNN